ncbi:minor extracellular serine protease Vpr [Croceifilum oryzae]|uniref:Minor extracellular serine protease Vpr n=1 Tax=Croceifilum oryzae TaxID=1553429 RepID=A0AAJ1WTP4_9BACL|nr:S8 family serine peptidase [Croceifilum oryzae]MDQ0417206.1 minor extracellular serine protease Vpr [Croceifilum oryzae]
MKKSIVASLSLTMAITCISSYSHAKIQDTPQEFTGKGVKVAVIDSGIDKDHPDLRKNYLGGYDFVDNDDNPEDTAGHGTHVAGIIAANGKIKGVAPEASLLVYRAWDGSKGGTNEIVRAIDRAITDGAEVINISLGIPYYGTDTPINKAIQKAIDKNITVVTAAGNAGSDPWMITSLASTPEAITVGNVKQKGISRTMMSVPGGSQDIEFGLDSDSSNPKPGKYPTIHLSTLTLDTIQKQDLADKMVVANIDDKHQSQLLPDLRKKSVAAILLTTSGSQEQKKQDAGLSSKRATTDNKVPEDFFTREKEVQLLEKAGKEQKVITVLEDKEERIASNSSSGPTVGSWQIKPDFAAPGTKIKSTFPMDMADGPDKGYETISGTSMASPYVAGAAALLKQAHPDWSPSEIRGALASTAKLVKDRNNQFASPFVQGSGQIDITEALKAEILPLTNNLSFGFLNSNTGIQTITQSLKIKNVSNHSQTFVAKNQLLEGKAEIQIPDSITIPAHDTVTVPVKFKVDTSLPISKHVGTISLVQGKKQISIPYLAVVDPKDYSFGTIYGEYEMSTKNLPYVVEYYTPFSAEKLTISIKGQTADNQPISAILMEKNHAPRGYQQFRWNGVDIHNKKIPKGTYELILQTQFNKRSYQQSIPLTID